MGLCTSAPDPTDPAAQVRSREIDRSLRDHARGMKQRIKFLLLGAGGCGKSTFLTQMKILYDDSTLPPSEVLKLNIRAQLVDIIRKFTHLLFDSNTKLRTTSGQILDVPEEFYTSTEIEEILDQLNSDRPVDHQAFAPLVKKIVESQFFKETVIPKLPIIDIGDSSSYIFDNIERFAAPTFEVNSDDMPHIRVKTVGVTEHKFLYPYGKQKLPVSITDVGGQRVERTKWIHAFSDVTCLLFFASLSDYDKVLEEDPTANAMLESLTLFDELVNSRWFVEKPVVLMLNKKDLLPKKMQTSPLNKCFAEFPANGTAKEAMKFVAEKFKQYLPPNKVFLHHFSTAIDRQNVHDIFDNVRAVICAQALDSI